VEGHGISIRRDRSVPHYFSASNYKRVVMNMYEQLTSKLEVLYDLPLVHLNELLPQLSRLKVQASVLTFCYDDIATPEEIQAIIQCRVILQSIAG